MNVILTLEHISLILSIITVALVVMIVRIRSVDKRLKKAEAFIRGLIAHANNVPTPTDPALHQLWLRRFNELDESPKKTAYRNRLIEVGMLDKDGHAIP